MRPTWRTLWRVVRSPVRAESRALLAANRARLPERLHTPRQMLGRQGNGCGATIGTMPRCDFACRGCYLGGEANTVPPASVDAIKAQIRALRPLLGPNGNLQLTDGEVTLRDPGELVELLRYARSLELIPMLMTHGDSFRRRPGLLERLIVEGGLREVSIHVDTTQRGRLGARWRDARREVELNPLRDELASLLRRASASTGVRLRSATTVTVTRDNVHDVPDVMRWLRHNADVFRMVSFQPIAQVGRTEDGLGGDVSVELLWEQIAAGLWEGPDASDRLARSAKWLGHPECNRFVHGLVYVTPGEDATFHPVRDEGDPMDRRVVDGFLERFGGISFRGDDHVLTTIARGIGVLAAEPAFMARSLPSYAAHWLRRFGSGHALRAARGLLTGRAHVHGLAIVSHHFMSRAQLDTPIGQERLEQCVFHVAIDGEAHSMCEVNATGLRDAFYAQLRRAGRSPGTALETGGAMPVLHPTSRDPGDAAGPIPTPGDPTASRRTRTGRLDRLPHERR